MSKKRNAQVKLLRRQYTIYNILSTLFGTACLLLVAFLTILTVRYLDFADMRAYLDRDTYYPGTYVDGINIGGYTYAAAKEAFGNREEEYAAGRSITFKMDGETYSYDGDAIGYSSDYESILLKAWKVGRTGTIDARYTQAQKGGSFTITRGYDETMVRAITDELAQQLTVDAVDATIVDFKTNTGEFVVTDEQRGAIVDTETLYLQALESIDNGTSVDVEAEVIEPKLTKADIDENYGMLSSAITNASSSNSNRLNNIQLACNSISGTILQPGEEFSFNAVVGKRTADAGYKVAGVFSSGELAEEIGGGICQVATTLFNAVVKADLEITERHPHSRPVSYVDKGKDATVSWGIQDLKFVNSWDEPIYIVAGVSSDKRVKIYVFGRLRTDGLTISLSTRITEVLQPGSDKYTYTSAIPTGTTRVKTESRKGYRVNTYKIYTDANGNAVSKEFLCSSSYPAAAAVIEVGS